MANYTVTNRKSSDSVQFQVALIIIFFISSIFVPFIILYPIQEVLYRPADFWFFEAPLSTYLILCVAMILLSVVMLVNVLVQTANKRAILFRRVIVTLSFVLAVGVLFLCINNYQYMNAKGIYQNKFFGFKEDFTSWEEVVKAEQTHLKKNSITKADKLIFTLKDGAIIELQITGKLSQNKTLIRESLRNNEVILENILPKSTK